MTLSGDALRRIREAFSEATAMPIDEATFAARFGLPANSERDGVNGPGALGLRYLSQGLPGFRGSLPEWSYQRSYHHDKPDKVLRRPCARDRTELPLLFLRRLPSFAG